MILARHVLCILGKNAPFDDLDSADALIQRLGKGRFTLDRDYSSADPDPRMKRSFEVSADTVRPSMIEADWADVRDHRSVLYVLSEPVKPEEALPIADAALQLIGALLEAGAAAVKHESVGLVHGRERWIALAADAAGSDPVKRGFALFQGMVKRPLAARNADVWYTCGMHLLGKPDVEVRHEGDEAATVNVLDMFGYYSAFEAPSRGLREGEGFRPGLDAPRYLLRAVPCRRYREDDFKFNPHGYWWLVREDAAS